EAFRRPPRALFRQPRVQESAPSSGQEALLRAEMERLLMVTKRVGWDDLTIGVADDSCNTPPSRYRETTHDSRSTPTSKRSRGLPTRVAHGVDTLEVRCAVDLRQEARREIEEARDARYARDHVVLIGGCSWVIDPASPINGSDRYPLAVE